MSTPTTKRRDLTPPKVAKRYGISPEKVVHWILTGELRAINVATNPNGLRPRYRIDEADLEDFERRRAVSGPAPKPTRRRQKPEGVTEYF